MCNIGCRPTVGAGNTRTIETHIFDFDEDIYGLYLEVTFISRIREEVRFGSLDELRVQLEKDRDACQTVIKTKILWTES
jgi:riboflavin kinase/FMN adenylyltransferase